MADKEMKLQKNSILNFQWTVPNLITVLNDNGNSINSSEYVFCDGPWSLNISRDKMLIRCRFKSVGNFETHIKTVKIRMSILLSGGDISFDLPEQNLWLADFNDEDANSEFSWMHIRQTDSLKINCKITCFDCKDELTERNERNELKRKYPEEVGEHFRSRRKLLRPSDSYVLQEDMKNMLTSNEDIDVVIKVKGNEFKAHKNIIRVRSPVLYNMLSHNMAEISGTIDITDCDPAAFQRFLTYLYSGNLDNISNDIVFDLYDIGDKFRLEEVKEICVIYMLEHLSVQTFCDIIRLSLKHKESELLETVSKFFVRNRREITETEQWISFFREHPGTGNDLHVLARYHSLMKTNAKINYK